MDMENTISYLQEYGDQTFAQKPFSEVDSLILCQLSYLKFDHLVAGIGNQYPPVLFRFMKRRKQFDTLFTSDWFEESFRELYDAVYRSRRFQSLKVHYYVNIIDEEREIQFSAVTFFLEQGITYIAYRGTDETILGWKEDFNMAFLSPIPAQEEALNYLQRVIPLIRAEEEFTVMLGGHSKGGNAAVYAAMKCDPLIRSHITQVYCFDGPGFKDDVYREEGYLEVKDRIIKLVPEASLIGMLLQNRKNYQVVKSADWGVLQHDTFGWVVKDGAFECVKEVTRASSYSNTALNTWINSLTREERRAFVDHLFTIINASSASTVVELSDDRHKNMMAMIERIKNMDKDSRKFMRQVIMLLFRKGKKKNQEILHISEE